MFTVLHPQVLAEAVTATFTVPPFDGAADVIGEMVKEHAVPNCVSV